MALKIMGTYPKLERFETGLFSLDAAARSTGGTFGLPLRTIYEIYGRPGVGKSSLSYYLAGKTGQFIDKDSRIDLCDLEILDPDYVVGSFERTGFEGTLNFMSTRDAKLKRRLHEDLIQELADNLELDEVSCGILDSIGALVPVAEAEGDVGEANMGRRAKMVAQMTRKMVRNLRDLTIPKNVYIVNHVASIIGGRGHTTPGGESPKFLGAVRVMIKFDEVIENSKGEILAFVSKGEIEKLRYGSRGRSFKFVVIPGFGVSPELTAVIDCVELGLASRKSVVKLGSENMGYLSKLVESAKSGYDKTFQPFFDALTNYKTNTFNQLSLPEMETIDESEEIDIYSPPDPSAFD